MTSSAQSDPAWKALDPVEFGDLMSFWAAQAWPLSREEVLRLAVERFGWEIEIDGGKSYLMTDSLEIAERGLVTQGSGSASAPATPMN